MPADALIVAHGSPRDPAPQEAAVAALAVRVAMWLPGWRVRGVTLAAPGALKAALGRLDRPVILPFFLAEGWFTQTHLPARLAETGLPYGDQRPAFGSDPGLPALAADLAHTAARQAGMDPATCTLLLAAHGSQVSRASAQRCEALAAAVRAMSPFARVVTGYIEEPPFLADAAQGLGPAICLPLFAQSAGHVTGDIPQALEQAAFTGPVLPPIGAAAPVARLIARSLHPAA